MHQPGTAIVMNLSMKKMQQLPQALISFQGIKKERKKLVPICSVGCVVVTKDSGSAKTLKIE